MVEHTGSLGLGNVFISHHPLLHAKLSLLRCAKTSSGLARRLTGQVANILAYEATAAVFTPKVVGQAESSMGVMFPVQTVDPKRVALVPVLRSGLAMTDAFLSILSEEDTVIHHLGIFRDNKTLLPVEYYKQFPSNKTEVTDIAIVLDPVIATGGTAESVIRTLRDWGVKKIVYCSLLASSQGIIRAAHEWPTGTFFHIGEVDEEITDEGYIIPGIGDIGDRLFSTQ